MIETKKNRNGGKERGGVGEIDRRKRLSSEVTISHVKRNHVYLVHEPTAPERIAVIKRGVREE